MTLHPIDAVKYNIQRTRQNTCGALLRAALHSIRLARVRHPIRKQKAVPTLEQEVAHDWQSRVREKLRLRSLWREDVGEGIICAVCCK